MLYQVHLAWVGYELTTLVVIGNDYIGSYKLALLYSELCQIQTLNKLYNPV